MKPHEIAKLVNELTKAAKEFHGAQQLRERISQLVVSAWALPDVPLKHVEAYNKGHAAAKFEAGIVRGDAQPVAAMEDMPAICAALGFDPTNHHNAAKCPYCTPQPATAPEPLPLTNQEVRQWWAAENSLEDCDMCKLDDFEKVVRTLESKLHARQAIHGQPQMGEPS